jgi:hypothetical protein
LPLALGHPGSTYFTRHWIIVFHKSIYVHTNYECYEKA